MRDVLSSAEYLVDPATNVWMKPGYHSIAYSDGDEIESRIFN